MIVVSRILCAALAMLPAATAVAAPPAPAAASVRIYSDYAATDPGTDALQALLARGNGLENFGLPSAGPSVVSTDADDWTVWSTGYGRSTSVRSRSAGSGALKSGVGGFVVGADRRVNANVIGGFAVGYADAGLREAATPYRGSAQAVTLAAYGAATVPDIAFGAAAVQYGFTQASAGSAVATTSYSPSTVRAGVLIGHFIDLSGFTFTPVAELEYAHTDGASLQASGAGALTLDVAGQDTLTSRIGLRINSAFFRWGILGSPYVAVLWERRLKAADSGGATRPLPLEPSDATVTGGITIKLPGEFNVGFEVGGRFGSRVDEQLGRLSFSKSF